MSRNFTLLAIVLVQVALMPQGNARSIASTATEERSSLETSLEASRPQNNATSRVATVNLAQVQDTSEKLQVPRILRHVVRDRRELTVPFAFDTKHLPCDMDMTPKNLQTLIAHLPDHCVWAYNNRYVSEDRYRVYKLYQLEAFLFGQYHERLRRFEMDPHTWDYASIVT